MAHGDLHTNVNISMSNIVCSGALFYSLSTQRFLFLHRSNGKRSNAVWGLVGGTNEGAETPWEGLRREIDEEFLPTLNKEHDGYAWCSFSKWPKPLHYGLQNTLNKKVNLKKLETVFEVINLLD